jgi:hypothetical protein
MNKIPRLIPERKFPDYIFIPGKNPHPKKTGGHMEGEKDPVSAPIDKNHPQNSDALKYALDLHNHGYFWEAHVYFEALWNAHQRTGHVADFLKALIKLSAAGVKININQGKIAEDHFERAIELFNSIGTDDFLGFDLEELKKLAREKKVGPILPNWAHSI